MKSLNRLIVLFALLFALFFIGPPLLSGQFGPYNLMKNGDVFDLLTPLVLIPITWLLFWIGRDFSPGRWESVVFMIVAALWVEGQGIHLAGNSIGHLLAGFTGTDAEELTHFYDETLSHYMWHLGVIGLSVLLLIRQWKLPFLEGRSRLLAESLGGLVYGFTYFLIIIEGATAIIGIPYAVVVAAAGLYKGRDQFRRMPLLAFFTIAAVFSTLLFLIWFIWQGGLPEFSEVGLLD